MKKMNFLKKSVLVSVLFALSVSSVFSQASVQNSFNSGNLFYANKLSSGPVSEPPSPGTDRRPPRDHGHDDPFGPSGHPSTGNIIADIFSDLITDIIVATDFTACFDTYPYATSPFYVQYVAIKADDFPARFWNFQVSATGLINSFRYDPNSDLPIVTPVIYADGCFYRFFGPVMEFSPSIGNDFSNFKLGLQLSVIQSFVFNFSVSGQWSHYYNYSGDHVNGFTWGFAIKSYPFKPVILEYRLNVTELGDNDFATGSKYDPDQVLESYLELGLMVSGPVEVFGCWRYKEDGLMQRGTNSLGFGVKLY